MWFYYLIWPVVLCIWAGMLAYLSKFSNETLNIPWYANRWVWLIFFCSLTPIWVFVTRVSHNLVFDALLFDVLSMLAFQMTLIYLGLAAKFVPLQWIGLVLVIFGFFLIRGVDFFKSLE